MEIVCTINSAKWKKRLIVLWDMGTTTSPQVLGSTPCGSEPNSHNILSNNLRRLVDA
jgi:hypothetical protein